MAFDILIKNGTLIDGTGRERYPADVGINKNAIAEIGDLKNQKAEKVIDAANLHVVPGFIDVLNHSDTYWTMFPMPSMESLLRQGITTIIGGNCGASLAPLVEGNVIAAIQKWADMSEVSINWLRMSEFLEQLERMKFGVNFGTLVGHGTLRRGLIKDEVRNLTGDEMAKIKFMLEEALESGAFGLSTGLAFSHAKTTPVEEIIELAKLVEKYDGVYASHLRDEAGRLDDSVTETIRVAMESQAKIQISHFKAMGQSGWPNFAANLERLEQAHDGGLNVNFDVFPYTVTGSVLYTLLPDWAAEGGKKKLLSRLRDPHERRKIIHELKKNPLAEYDKIIVAISPADKTFIGKSLKEIAQNQGVEPEEALLNMILVAEDQLIAFIHSLSEENVAAGIASKISMVSSDGSGYNLGYARKGTLVHPRSFGAFPRLLGKYVREEKKLSWEEAVRKISSLPAEKYGLKKRGLITESNFADLTIYNPETVSDLATFKNPYLYPRGVEYVIVNGKTAIEKGVYNGELAGRVLRKS
ncbi:MAG: hypothetical protein UX33_C0019G0007 [Candidatus Azambacteria bacterium GW2011_GWC1_46_13]|uniref:Amidohydrolase 3 domain-containing protein n=1 Tax=Candidatus Azambacteria bacterium GW2011_GWC1_46_13 TaxID=1618619 RepID=A0A0G1RLV2_9BACT|nr:MAG: hypothetical protein UX33_C0019G0007 [Candidatus Azambacteria bacterium GW2011_GWC1_46_13]